MQWPRLNLEITPPNYGLNDKKDAFRHAFFNALNTRDVTPRGISPYPPPVGWLPYTSAQIVTMFANAHESEVPVQLIKEKVMDVHNNTEGINYCQSCNSTYTNSYISEAIMQILLFGSLHYLSPLLPPPFFSDGTPNPNGDPNYNYSHGITNFTLVMPTNQ